MPSIGKIAENPLNIAIPRAMVKIQQVFGGGFACCCGFIEHIEKRGLGLALATLLVTLLQASA